MRRISFSLEGGGATVCTYPTVFFTCFVLLAVAL